MTQRTGGLYRLLYFSGFYQWFQDLLGDRAFMRAVADDWIRPRPGDRLLDLGCGVGSLLAYLPQVQFVGVDHNADYIERARQRFGKRGTFLTVDLNRLQYDPGWIGGFQIITLICVTHHLSDSEVLALFGTLGKFLAPEGRLCLVDPCFHEDQPWLARQLAKRDRGEHVRDESEYERLAREAFASVRAEVRQGILRLPYSHLFLEAHGPRGDHRHASRE
ncbi:MAG: class I SAM-dependent methyltransferase [Magnetococcales bacterium]|nr:class I SAM-dependent methyltransferase [Magnetococcales bacterium]